jgi:hypothetical protein
MTPQDLATPEIISILAALVAKYGEPQPKTYGIEVLNIRIMPEELAAVAKDEVFYRRGEIGDEWAMYKPVEEVGFTVRLRRGTKGMRLNRDGHLVDDESGT